LVKKPSRWPVRLGWLLVLGSIGISLAAATGQASEKELVAASLYVVLVFAFGVGMIIGAWREGRSGSSPRDCWVMGLIVGACLAGAAAYGRHWFLEHVFYR
jgi:hypothetical protein